ncbi:MAG: YihY/virulence factor BrkB family protein, partial [Gemmatimonadota bacterium]|nr:YihY/virulence factor BrkB family protein [Gemmatimonadota bacterium]
MPPKLSLREVPGLLWTAAKNWSSDNVPRLGASLAYYTLFSMAPVLVIAIAIAGLVFGADAVRGEIVGQIQGIVGADGAQAVQALLEGASKRGSGVVAIVIGGVTFVLAATGVFLELQYALNTIFRVKLDPAVKISILVKTRLRSFGLVLTLGFVLLVSLAVSATLSAMSGWFGHGAALTTVWQMVNVLVSFGVITMLFALIYRFLPDVKLLWRDVWVGAVITAIFFTIGKQLLGLYLGRSSTTSSYGAAGSVIVLLLWVYYTAQIILFGAELTRVYTERVHGKPEKEEYAVTDPLAHPTAETLPGDGSKDVAANKVAAIKEATAIKRATAIKPAAPRKEVPRIKPRRNKS